MIRARFAVTACVAMVLSTAPAFAQTPDARLATYKTDAARGVDELAKMAQEMVDSVFSFGELGFQEVETSKYLTGLLEAQGFKVQRGVSGIPTAWVATWGSASARRTIARRHTSDSRAPSRRSSRCGTGP